MGMEFRDDADTRNRVKALQHELSELHSFMEKLTQRIIALEDQAREHYHYPLSPDYGKPTYGEPLPIIKLTITNA